MFQDKLKKLNILDAMEIGRGRNSLIIFLKPSNQENKYCNFLVGLVKLVELLFTNSELFFEINTKSK